MRSPSGFGDHSVSKGLERARLAKTLNLPFNPELGLFNIYGDIRCQPWPDFSEYPELKVSGDWTALTLGQMLPALRSYGAIAAREIPKTGKSKTYSFSIFSQGRSWRIRVNSSRILENSFSSLRNSFRAAIHSSWETTA